MHEIITKTFGQTTTTGQLTQSVTSASKPIEEYIQKPTQVRKKSTSKVSTTGSSPQLVEKANYSQQLSSPEQNKEKNIPKSVELNEHLVFNDSTSKPIPLDAFAPNLIPHKPQFSSRDDWIQTKTFPLMRLISQSGQLNKVYFVFEGDEGFYILDMHAADERINFEKEKRAYEKGGMKMQRLIVPFTIEVPVNMKDFLMEVLSELSKFGFEVEHLGGNTFTLHAIPAILKTVTDTQILTDICLEILQIGKESSLTKSIDTIIKYMACHESIRGGDIITDPNLPKELLINLSQCENPHHCAHGRPTMLFFSWKYLEKEFHRQ
jgi:DNA mismatch repair ATPase MutL